MVEVQNGLISYLASVDKSNSLQLIETSGSAGTDRLLFFWGLVKILGLCLSKKIDIAHIHMASRGSAIRKTIISKFLSFFGIPYILHIHSGEFSSFYSRQPKLLKHAINGALSNASHVVVLSDGMRDWCNNVLGVSRALVIRNGCRDIGVINSQAFRSRDILFLGRLNRNKGVDDLLSAIKIVANKKPNITVTIAGDGDIMHYTELAKHKGIHQNLNFTGWVERKSCDYLLLTHKVFILPSYFEGMPMSLLEAMSANTPILSTNIGGIPEVIKNGINGVLVAPGDVAAISDGILLLLNNQSFASSISRVARADYEEKFSSNVMGRKFMDLYKKTLIEKAKNNK